MSVQDVGTSISSPPIPRPRTDGDAPVTARYPWPEPWRSTRGSRPRTEYWDVATASWRSRDPLPRPATND
jgi:hypothetical protein